MIYGESMKQKQEAKAEPKMEEAAKIDEKDKKIAELTDCLQRLQAEFENYKKRAEKENGHFMKFANANLIGELLPLLDSFEFAFKNKDSKEFVQGVELIFAQLFSILEKQGLRPIHAEGKKFDPYKHEVLLQEPSDKDEIVLEELQKGYMLQDKVLRFSKVKIGKKAEPKEEKK
jgi:molecular chaperone GrpE